MFDEHLSPVLMACSEAELAVLIEFLGRPPSGLLWVDRRLRDPRLSRAGRVEAVIERILRLGAHSVLGRTPPGGASYLQIVCDVLAELELSEVPASGIAELEGRVVRYMLDAGFAGLPEATQAALLAGFESGEMFADGVPEISVVHDFLTHVEPQRRALVAGRTKAAIGDRLRVEAVKQAKSRLLRAGLRVVLRDVAGPVYQMIRLWGFLGPAFRYTVPTIVYVAYLRGTQAARAAGGAGEVAAGREQPLLSGS